MIHINSEKITEERLTRIGITKHVIYGKHEEIPTKKSYFLTLLFVPVISKQRYRYTNLDYMYKPETRPMHYKIFQ
jgi:hypothetical protein